MTKTFEAKKHFFGTRSDVLLFMKEMKQTASNDIQVGAMDFVTFERRGKSVRCLYATSSTVYSKLVHNEHLWDESVTGEFFSVPIDELERMLYSNPVLSSDNMDVRISNGLGESLYAKEHKVITGATDAITLPSYELLTVLSLFAAGGTSVTMYNGLTYVFHESKRLQQEFIELRSDDETLIALDIKSLRAFAKLDKTKEVTISYNALDDFAPVQLLADDSCRSTLIMTPIHMKPQQS